MLPNKMELKLIKITRDQKIKNLIFSNNICDDIDNKVNVFIITILIEKKC